MNKLSVFCSILFAIAGVALLAVFSFTQSASAAFRIVLAGAPASGKGTAAALLRTDLNATHLSTGDLLRAEIAAKSELGRRVEGIVAEGRLVPDELLVPIVSSRLRAISGSWILDGFPRSASQAEALWCTEDTETVPKPTHVVLLDVRDETAVARMAKRRVDPATGNVYTAGKDLEGLPAEVRARLVVRPDDTEERIRARLATFHANTAAWLDVVRRCSPRTHIVTISAEGSVEEVHKSISEALMPEYLRRLSRFLECGSVMKPFC